MTARLKKPMRKRPLHMADASNENTVDVPLVGCGDLPAVNGQDTPTSLEPEKSFIDSLWASMRAGGRIATRWDPRSTASAEAAKEALQTDKLPTYANPIRCRVEEFVRIRRRLRNRLNHVRSGVILLSGPSGTGKSVALQQAEKLVRCWSSGSKPGSEQPKRPRALLHPPIVAHVNCVALPDLQRVRDKIIEEFRKYHGDLPPFAEVGPLASPDRMTVILLDGIDHLVSDASWETLTQLNSTAQNATRCILVGVIKDEDLTRVAVSKFKNLGFEPNVIRFKAYDSDQLKLLLRVRLGCLPWTVFEWAGLELCARKVAATTGDMHRALNICAAALDICVREANEAAAKTEDRETLHRRARKAASASLVKIWHMARAISKWFPCATIDTIVGLPQYDRVVLYAAERFLKNDVSRRDLTLEELYQATTILCEKVQIPVLTRWKFSSVCRALSVDHELVEFNDEANDRVRLTVQRDDVFLALCVANETNILRKAKRST